jgi:UDP-glucose 4-epimerase
MNILVTGGAGYVGSHCARALLDAGHAVIVYDNLSTGHRAAVDRRATMYTADLADEARLNAAFAQERPDAVMHFAASLDVGESVREPLLYYRNNVGHTISLLEAMRRAGVRKLVFSSTCATYGIPASMPIREDMPQHPINPYGRTKLSMEWALRDCAGAWGLGSTALRYFNAAGASADATLGEDHEPEIHLIPLTLQVALGRRREILIFGSDYPTRDGTCIRDYIHVEDLAAAHRLALESQREGEFRCYNVGTGTGVSVREIVSLARSITGHAIPSRDAPRRPGDPPELYADPAKIQRELGWRPAHADPRRIIETAWNWHRRSPQGFPRSDEAT